MIGEKILLCLVLFCFVCFVLFLFLFFLCHKKEETRRANNERVQRWLGRPLPVEKGLMWCRVAVLGGSEERERRRERKLILARSFSFFLSLFHAPFSMEGGGWGKGTCLGDRKKRNSR